MSQPIRVLHLTTGLNTGGAEIILARLVTHLDPLKFKSQVISMLPPGPVADQLQANGIHVMSLNMSAGRITPNAVFRLTQLIRNHKPDIIQTWMYHADFLGGLGARLAGDFPGVWGLHNSTVTPGAIKKSTYLIIKACAFLSNWIPATIISVSRQAIKNHIEAGYNAKKFVFIPNGFDLQAFHPIASAHIQLSRVLGISENSKIIGLIARFDPQKDINNFIKAAAIIRKKIPGVHFVLCGDNMLPSNPILADWIKLANIHDRIHLLGRRDDIPQIMAGLDIAALSSCGEAFPLVLGEAMACGVPCVSTDVGDAALLVGETGKVVPPQNSEALSEAIIDLLYLPQNQIEELGKKARQRIEENFGLEQMVTAYASLYESLAKPR
jgi:glycosyltransferase involved in cell wall biosynthesis